MKGGFLHRGDEYLRNVIIAALINVNDAKTNAKESELCLGSDRTSGSTASPRFIFLVDAVVKRLDSKG